MQVQVQVKCKLLLSAASEQRDELKALDSLNTQGCIRQMLITALMNNGTYILKCSTTNSTLPQCLTLPCNYLFALVEPCPLYPNFPLFSGAFHTFHDL